MHRNYKTLAVLLGFLVFFIVLDRIPALFFKQDTTSGFLLSGAVTVLGLFIFEMTGYRRSPVQAFYFLGFGRPDWRALGVTGLIGAALLLFFPLYSSVSGQPVALPANWPWKLVGLVALHGIAEEALFRGFLFHHLREGRTFGQAGRISLLVFAAAHLYLFTYMPPALALFGTFLALASAFPFAYLFERGRNTLWAPALLHSLVHAVSLVEIPASHAMQAGIIWMCLWIAVVLLMYAFRRRLFEGPAG